MSVLDQSVKNAIEVLEATGGDVPALLEEERAGKNRKSMITWLEKQDAIRSSAPSVGESENVDTSAPEVEPVYVEPEAPKVAVVGIDSIEGGEMAISELISVLCQKRDRWQRSTSCGLENIRVHLSDIQISVR